MMVKFTLKKVKAESWTLIQVCKKTKKPLIGGFFKVIELLFSFYSMTYTPIFSIWASLIFRRRILPTLDFGSSSVKKTSFGTL